MLFCRVIGALLLLGITPALATPLAGCQIFKAASTTAQTATATPTISQTSAPATTTSPPTTTTSPEMTSVTTTTPATTTPAITTTTPTTTLPTGEVNILSHSSYIKHGKWTGLISEEVYEGDFLHIMGEIQNVGQVNVDDFEMDAVYFDANGTALSVTGRIYLDEDPKLLTPGEKGPFLLILFDEEVSKNTASYELSVEFNATTEQPYQLNIMGDRNYINKWGTYGVLGELENAGESNIESVKIWATFYDENGRVIDMDFTYTDVGGLRTLIPGQKSPFNLWTSRGDDVNDKIRSYSLRARCRTTDREVYRGFQILNDTSNTDTWGDLTIEGQIKNIGGQDATFVKVVATCYRADNTVAAIGYTYADPRDLKAGETGQFKIYVTLSRYGATTGEIACYTLDFSCSNY
jgi:hypothetical protein